MKDGHAKRINLTLLYHIPKLVSKFEILCKLCYNRYCKQFFSAHPKIKSFGGAILQRYFKGGYKMARVQVKAMTKTQPREGLPPDNTLVEVPSLQDITTQLTKHFKGSIPEQEITELASIISTEFNQLKDLPYGDEHPMSKFAVYTRPKPELVINVYTDGCVLFQQEFYPADYSTVRKFYHNHKTITVVNAVKRIQLAYVKRPQQ